MGINQEESHVPKWLSEHVNRKLELMVENLRPGEREAIEKIVKGSCICKQH